MITQSELKEIFDYDSETGEFRHRIAGKRRRVGEIAGSAHARGYWTLHVNRRHILAHRAAMLWMTGEMPKEVDHIDGIGRNNRFANLRSAITPENRWNTRTRSDNTSGHKGIEVKLTVAGYLIVKASVAKLGKTYTKSFSITKYGEPKGIELAKAWLDAKRMELHGEFACDGSRSSQT